MAEDEKRGKKSNYRQFAARKLIDASSEHGNKFFRPSNGSAYSTLDEGNGEPEAEAAATVTLLSDILRSKERPGWLRSPKSV